MNCFLRATKGKMYKKRNIPYMGCAQSRRPEEMVPLFTTHPTGIWVHCDKGHKTCGLPMNKYLTHVPLHLHVAAGSELNTGRKATVFMWGVCHLEPVQSTRGWAMSGPIDIKALNLSFQGKKRKRKMDSNSGKGKTMETIKRSMVATCVGGERR